MGRSVRSAPSEMTNSDLRERVGLLTGLIKAKHGERTNSLQGLAQNLAQGAGQDAIASMTPAYNSAMYYPITLDYTLLGYLYTTHGVLQTMIDEPVADAFSDDEGPGFTLSSQEMGEGIERVGVGGSEGKDGLSELMDFAEETGVWEEIKFFLALGSLYGGSGLVINAGQDPEKPLEESDIKRGRLEFYAADRWEFSGEYRSAASFSFYGSTLDASRVITYGGKRAPRIMRVTLGGWGMSELQRAIEDFNVWLRGRNAIYEYINKANIDVYSIDNYANTLSLPGGQDTITARIQATNSILNFAKALILDSNDKYQVVSKSWSGMAEVMREVRVGLSCATRIPYQKLWGTSAGTSGLADGGEVDMENYNRLVMSRVRAPARPIIRKVLRLLMLACFGKEYDVSFKWQKMRVLSAVAEEGIKTSKQSRYLALRAQQLLTSQEMGDLMHRDGLVEIETAAQRGELPDFQPLPTTGDMFGGGAEGGEEGGAKKDGGYKPAEKKKGGDDDGPKREADED